jgi:hypothetical protein
MSPGNVPSSPSHSTPLSTFHAAKATGPGATVDPSPEAAAKLGNGAAVDPVPDAPPHDLQRTQTPSGTTAAVRRTGERDATTRLSANTTPLGNSTTTTWSSASATPLSVERAVPATPRRAFAPSVTPPTPHPGSRYKRPSISFTSDRENDRSDDRRLEESFDRSRYESSAAKFDGTYVNTTRRGHWEVETLNEESMELIEEEEIS